MKMEKANKTDRGKSFFDQYRFQIILLGIIIVAVICWLFPAFCIPILIIAAGLAIPPLFSPWKLWAGYGFQVGIAPGLAFILMGIFILLFGYDIDTPWSDEVANLFQTNVVVLLIWFVLIVFLFRRRQNSLQEMQDYDRGERWRDYRWVIAPAVLILLFLFNTSWAQSTLSTLSLKKSVFKSASFGALEFHVEYPSQILFDDTEPSEIHLWATGSFYYLKPEISGEGLLFAVKPSSDASVEWGEELKIQFDQNISAITLLARPAEPSESDSQVVQLKLRLNGRSLETSDWLVIVESKRDSHVRDWKKNFLSTGSTIVSLITAVFVGIKQLEEEKKRQKAKQIEQAISNFGTNVKNDLPKVLQENLELITDWNEWDRALQNQFRDTNSSFIESGLWDTIANKTLEEIKGDVNLILQICKRIFEDEEIKPASIKRLHNALQHDAHALLFMLKEHPESISIAKQIAGNLPDNLKKKIPEEHKNEFLQEIILLKEELGFPDIESFPLQSRFRFYSFPSQADARLAAWLEQNKMCWSPFADAASPYTTTPLDKNFFIEHVPGFLFSIIEHSTQNFAFVNTWDTDAALFEYARNLPQKIKTETFVLTLTPAMMVNFGMEQPRELLLHALAEGWLWTSAESPAMYYSLGKSQRALAGRLLRWHGGSPFAIVRRLEQILGRKKDEKGTRKFLENVTEWLTNIDGTNLRNEEIPALIELRPLSKQQFTLTLVSSVDWQTATSGEITSAAQQALDGEAQWLKSHGWDLVHFMTSDVNPQRISEEKLTKQCQERVRICSDGQVEALESLFAPHSEEPADLILARKANGSPGRMVRLGQKLLLQHIAKYPLDEFLHIEDLEALEV